MFIIRLRLRLQDDGNNNTRDRDGTIFGAADGVEEGKTTEVQEGRWESVGWAMPPAALTNKPHRTEIELEYPYSWNVAFR